MCTPLPNNCMFYPLVNDEIMDLIKLKAFADDTLKIAKMTITFFDRVEYTV